MKKRRSNTRAKRFASLYVANGFNGVQAVVDMGITQNRNSAHVIANRLIKTAVADKQIKEHLMQSKISADEVLEELSTMARAPVKDVSEAGKLKALELSGKALKLFVDRTETLDTTSFEARKSVIEGELKRLQAKHLDDPLAYDSSVAQLRQLFTDTTDPAYDPLLDYTKHPENWPADSAPQAVVTDSGSDNN